MILKPKFPKYMHSIPQYALSEYLIMLLLLRPTVTTPITLSSCTTSFGVSPCFYRTVPVCQTLQCGGCGKWCTIEFYHKCFLS